MVFFSTTSGAFWTTSGSFSTTSGFFWTAVVTCRPKGTSRRRKGTKPKTRPNGGGEIWGLDPARVGEGSGGFLNYGKGFFDPEWAVFLPFFPTGGVSRKSGKCVLIQTGACVALVLPFFLSFPSCERFVDRN